MTPGWLNPLFKSTLSNMKPLSRSLLCKWVKDAWDAIPSEAITKSFLSCAITTSINGQHDHEIHCFKPGQPCEAGRAALAQEMLQFNTQSESDDEDPFADEIDENEDERNEACIDELPEDGDPEFDNDSE